MRYLASVCYDGSKFYGFQKLGKNITVQKELEKALTKIAKREIFVKGAGRTDRGVHAFNQMVHFDLDVNISTEGLQKAINSVIDNGIYINYCLEVDDDFHARFSVKRKTYKYIINTGVYNAIDNDYLYNYCYKLNYQAMKKAGKFFKGYHSFKAFVSGTRENYDAVIYNVKIKKKKDIIVLTFVGKSFYSYMVRNMVGAIIQAGTGKMSPEGIKEMLIKEENIYNYSTVPAAGLYLVDIEY